MSRLALAVNAAVVSSTRFQRGLFSWVNGIYRGLGVTLSGLNKERLMDKYEWTDYLKSCKFYQWLPLLFIMLVYTLLLIAPIGILGKLFYAMSDALEWCRGKSETAVESMSKPVILIAERADKSTVADIKSKREQTND